MQSRFAPRRSIITTLFTSTFLFFTSAFPQMPDWKTVKDRDGNVYYIDRHGKIWTSGKPEWRYKPVSLDGIDFYVSHGIDLIKRHYKLEGLTLLKSIQALPVKNQKIYDAKVRASGEINRMIKREGDRFPRLNDEASLLMYREDGRTTVIDDAMLFSISFPFTVDVNSRKRREKTNYRYHGVTLGLTAPDTASRSTAGYSGYDALLAIDSEKFLSLIQSIDILEENWRVNLGGGTIDRTLLSGDENRRLYEIKTRHAPVLRGFEGYYRNGRYGYLIRTISAQNRFEKIRPALLEALNNFSPVNRVSHGY